MNFWAIFQVKWKKKTQQSHRLFYFLIILKSGYTVPVMLRGRSKKKVFISSLTFILKITRNFVFSFIIYTVFTFYMFQIITHGGNKLKFISRYLWFCLSPATLPHTRLWSKQYMVQRVCKIKSKLVTYELHYFSSHETQDIVSCEFSFF